MPMNLELTTALTDAQVRQLHHLYQNEWWTRGRTLEETRRMLQHSDYVFGLCRAETMDLVAFARVLTDRTFKAFVFDVIVAPEHRGHGLGKFLMDRILRHPDLVCVKHFELYCLPELAPFYERWGFSADVGGVVLLRKDGADVHPPRRASGPGSGRTRAICRAKTAGSVVGRSQTRSSHT